ncbi:MAG: FxsA family protein, partial [Myxococcota bacterium]|nr:FxsA family protein [Myxococcota bacterium]
MLGRLFLLFTLTTAAELILLLLVGRYVSIPFTIALIVLTGLLGAYLASREGRRAWRRVAE